jgi:hypothetical protein
MLVSLRSSEIAKTLSSPKIADANFPPMMLLASVSREA